MKDSAYNFDPKELIREALSAMKRAYTPYSHFQVGAALLTKDGKIYQGCNIENAAYGPTNCAERTAFFRAVFEGERDFEAICVVGGKEGIPTSYAAPCGVCRQVMAEFCSEDFEILLYDGMQIKVYKLGELLPVSFTKKNLE